MADYTETLQRLEERYGTRRDKGLSASRVEENREKYGENLLRGSEKQSLIHRFLLQMKDAMVLILLGAAAVSFGVALWQGEEGFLDSLIIVAIVVLNGALGVWQESRAEHALEALREMSAPTAKVIRDGAASEIPAAQVVRGDLVLLEAGDLVPCDGRIVSCAGLECEESALTGESVPVAKDAAARVSPGAALGDRLNMAYSGATVTRGRGTILATATGMDTEVGRVAGLLEGRDEAATPLQERLNRMGKYLGILALAICALIFLLGLLQGMPPVTIFMTAVSLAVAAIPEGLTAVVTVVLALGVQRMAKRNAIIRHLPAVETLGSASVICSDKTGTLTQNRMTVRRIWPCSGEPEGEGEYSPAAKEVLRLAALCNDGRVEEGDGVRHRMGDPTETTLVEAALDQGMGKALLEEEYPRIAEIPFDSVRKRMTTVHRAGGKLLSVTKGGLDVLLPLCPDADRARAEEVNRAMAGDALRVLAVCFRELDALPEDRNLEELERDLTLAGLVGMVDPPREESREAVALCHRAGIRTVMITGDHGATAGAIAREIGILEGDGKVITGPELQAMSDKELARQVESCRVYARVSPEDKIRIVHAWQEKGQVVAMTGDGVNDAPALKAADIGCAMGATGTEVAKGAADMVLTDDNFATIVEAVRSGRGIFDNIRKTVQFLLGSNLGEVCAVFFAMVLGWGTPLLAIHLLLINIVTDALPALALGVEPVESNVMDRKPIPREQGIFAGGLGWIIGLQGLMVGFLTLAGYYVGCFVPLSVFVPPSPEAGMTMAFLVLSLSQLVQAYNCRSNRSLYHLGLLSNPTMNKAFLGSLAIVLAICLVPPLERLFHTVDLSMLHWLWVLVLSCTPLALVEAGKKAVSIYRKRR